jgi:Tfp pilus assembly PilM family ATPase/Tfp pilus assembly protein PilN
MSMYLPGCQIVGVDIGSKAIKALKLTTSFNDFKITGFLIKERRGKSLEELSEDLRALTQEGSLQGDVIVASFPSHQAIFRTTEMPFAQLEKIEATIHYEAESIMISPLEAMVVDFTLLERSSERSSVLITCVQKELLQGYVDALREGGIVPDVIEIDSLALSRLMEELGEKEKDLALLDIGSEKTSVSIFQKGGLRVTRTIPIGVGAESEMDGVRRALEEVTFTIKAHNRANEGPVQEVWLTGGRSRIKGLDAYLEKKLGAKIIYPDLLGKFPSTVTLSDEANLLGNVALGLALRGLKREKGRVNLTRKISAPNQTFTPLLRKRIATIAGALVLLLALIGANFYLGIAMKEKRYTMLKGEIRRVFKEGFPTAKGVVNELQQAKEMVKGMGEKGVKIKSHGGYSLLEILREIAQYLPQGAKIVELDMDEGRITLRGTASSFSLVDEVKKSLMTSPLFQDLRVGNVELSRRGTEGVIFGMVLEMERK